MAGWPGHPIFFGIGVWFGWRWGPRRLASGGGTADRLAPLKGWNSGVFCRKMPRGTRNKQIMLPWNVRESPPSGADSRHPSISPDSVCREIHFFHIWRYPHRCILDIRLIRYILVPTHSDSPKHHRKRSSSANRSPAFWSFCPKFAVARHIRFWNTVNNMHLSSIDTGSQVCNLVWSKNLNEIDARPLPSVGDGGGLCPENGGLKPCLNHVWLVVTGWWILFSQKYWVSIIIPIDELIFFRGVA